MMIHASLIRHLALGLLLSLALIGSVAGAQSGRRTKPAAPVPVPTPEPTPPPTATSEKRKPELTFIVGIDKHGDFSRISLYAYDGVLRNCADRLNDSGSVEADVSSRDMSRAEAVRKAAAEKEAYVVWLELRQNTFGGDQYDVYVHYSVFAPVTAKLVTSGNTYPEAYQNKRMRLPTSSNNGDYYLNQAARGAAERILDHFRRHPSVKVP